MVFNYWFQVELKSKFVSIAYIIGLTISGAWRVLLLVMNASVNFFAFTASLQGFIAGDYHLWKKFADVADLYMVDSVLAGFRIHEGQLSGNIEGYRAEIGKLSRIQAFMSKYNLYKKTYSFSLKLKRLFCGKKSLKCKIIRIERK